MNGNKHKIVISLGGNQVDTPSCFAQSIKKIEKNEENTVVIQRRSIRAAKTLRKGEVLTKEVTSVLRPCPVDALEPWELDFYLGKKLAKDVSNGAYFKASDFE